MKYIFNMGDLIEFTTWPSKRPTYFRITTGGLVFGLKTDNKSLIGLATQPTGKNDVTIVLGCQNRVYILKQDKINEVQTTTSVNTNEYTTFWLHWTKAYTKIGYQGEREPLLTYRPGVRFLHYISFSTHDGRSPSHWKFELPPIKHLDDLKLFDEGKPVWQKYDNHLPDGVIIGGFENDEPLYIVRSAHAGSLTPGKYIPSIGLSFLPWGGETHVKTEFEALVGYNVTWVRTSYADIPYGAVVGGYSEVQHEPLYVGRFEIEGHLIPGKVQASHKVCYVPYKDREIPSSIYEILVVLNVERLIHVQVSEVQRFDGGLHYAFGTDYITLSNL